MSDLEADGLVNRTRDPSDGRIQWISATARGRRVLEKGRRARVRKLEEDVGRLDPGERAAIEQALSILEGLALPSDHPGHGGSEG